MQIVAAFNPNTSATTSFNATFPSGGGRMVIYNDSNINLQLAWESFTTFCPAWTAMLYCVNASNANIQWKKHSKLNVTGLPISQVVVEVYDNTEVIPGVFPLALVRGVNIGNNGVVVSTATNLVNDANIAGTQIIEATVAGDTASAVTLTNDGDLTLGDATNAGSLAVVGPASMASLALTVGTLSRISFFGPCAVSNTPTFFNHGLGVIPDFVFLQHVGGATTQAQSVVYDDVTMTATQVKLTGSASFAVNGVAIKM